MSPIVSVRPRLCWRAVTAAAIASRWSWFVRAGTPARPRAASPCRVQAARVREPRVPCQRVHEAVGKASMASTPPGSERAEQGKSLSDPGVVGAGVNTLLRGCPADAADRSGELELTVAGGLPAGRAAARAVDRDNRRPIANGKVNDLLARHVALQRQHSAVIDNRDVEALPLAAHINARPHRHTSQHAPSGIARILTHPTEPGRTAAAPGAAATAAKRNDGEHPPGRRQPRNCSPTRSHTARSAAIEDVHPKHGDV